MELIRELKVIKYRGTIYTSVRLLYASNRLLKNYLFHVIFILLEIQRSFIHWFTPQMPTTGWIQKLEMQFASPTWVAALQALEPPSAACQGAHQHQAGGGREAETQHRYSNRGCWAPKQCSNHFSKHLLPENETA